MWPTHRTGSECPSYARGFLVSQVLSRCIFWLGMPSGSGWLNVSTHRVHEDIAIPGLIGDHCEQSSNLFIMVAIKSLFHCVHFCMWRLERATMVQKEHSSLECTYEERPYV